MRPMQVLIAGRGVAALVCAQRLAKLGHQVVCYGPPTTEGPTVLVGEPTWDLLRSQFSFPTSGHPIHQRDIQWGSDWTTVPAPGRALSLATLVATLDAHCPSTIIRCEQRPTEQDWTWQLDATGRRAHLARALAAAKPQTFGRRCLMSASVTLKPDWSHRTAMELLPNGWLFLCPTDTTTGIVQWMQPATPLEPAHSLETALTQSTLIRPRITSLQSNPLPVFTAAPQILDVLGSDRWLALGAAALTFDPLCGEGIGQAIRSAYLASAVLTSPLPLQNKLRHYVLRHRQSFAWHLYHLGDFYRPLCSQAAWKRELDMTDAFLNSPLSDQLRHRVQFEYQLQDFQLVHLPQPEPAASRPSP